MKKFILLLCCVCCFSFVLPAAAQGSPQVSCDADSLLFLINQFSDALAKLKTSTEKDPVKLANELQALANTAASARAACDNLVFTGSKQVVIGPVTIPEGIYRAKATTPGYIAVTVDAIDGECGEGKGMSSSLFILSRGQADTGAEAVFYSKGCTALITFENITDGWTLSFERITTQ